MKEKKSISDHVFSGLIVLGILLLLAALYYIYIPIFNFGNIKFYFFVWIVASLLISLLSVLISKILARKNPNGIYYAIRYNRDLQKFIREEVTYDEKYSKISILIRSFILVGVVTVAFLAVMGLVGSKLFSAKAYYEQLEINEKSEDELKEVFDFDKNNVLLPIIDKDLAFTLAQASLKDYGAQYTIDYNNFTLISVNRNGKSELVRIAPLEYSTFFVSLSRIDQGTIGYIEVNVVTKETTLVKIDEGLKYMPSAILGYDLDRHIRFEYPTEMYDEYNFEIDDEGNPYWIIPTLKKEIGVISGPTAKGVIIVNPITGEINRYNLGEEPAWVDRTIDESIVDAQATNAFTYKNGYLNVHFGEKKEVFQLSDGYNYFIKDGQTYYVSCITSPNENDQTSIGFVTINLKTREAAKYYVSGITEMRAREIAMNHAEVRAQQLTATWPLLINYKDVETYFIVLKNAVQAQKMVLVNVKDGEIIAIADTIEEAKSEYDKLLSDSGNAAVEIVTIEGKVTRIRDLGETIEFMIDTHPEKYFVLTPSISLDARFIQVGDTLTMSCNDYNNYFYVLECNRKE